MDIQAGEEMNDRVIKMVEHATDMIEEGYNSQQVEETLRMAWDPTPGELEQVQNLFRSLMR